MCRGTQQQPVSHAVLAPTVSHSGATQHVGCSGSTHGIAVHYEIVLPVAAVHPPIKPSMLCHTHGALQPPSYCPWCCSHL
jgi:hypothetical protein